jgi:hypothetical protein
MIQNEIQKSLLRNTPMGIIIVQRSEFHIGSIKIEEQFMDRLY